MGGAGQVLSTSESIPDKHSNLQIKYNELRSTGYSSTLEAMVTVIDTQIDYANDLLGKVGCGGTNSLKGYKGKLVSMKAKVLEYLDFCTEFEDSLSAVLGNFT